MLTGESRIEPAPQRVLQAAHRRDPRLFVQQKAGWNRSVAIMFGAAAPKNTDPSVAQYRGLAEGGLSEQVKCPETGESVCCNNCFCLLLWPARRAPGLNDLLQQMTLNRFSPGCTTSIYFAL